jgi:hypothetical protein
VLFTGTVRYNLDPFGAAGDAALWAALDAVAMRARVAGLDDAVAEGGANWSVGERQVRAGAGAGSFARFAPDLHLDLRRIYAKAAPGADAAGVGGWNPADIRRASGVNQV